MYIKNNINIGKNLLKKFINENDLKIDISFSTL